MPRNLTPAALNSLFTQETDQVWAMLVTIDHPTFEQAIRVNSDNVQITSNGKVFEPYPFEIDLPSDKADEIARVTLTICNVDRRLTEAIRKATSSLTVSLAIVLTSQPNDIQMSVPDMTLRQVKYDALVISGGLEFEDILTVRFPKDDYRPGNSRGLFG